MSEASRAAADTDRELFIIQCRVLNLGTDTRLSAVQLRRALMDLRLEIIARRYQLKEQTDAVHADS